MKKPSPLIALFIFLVIIIGLIVGGYFLLNLIVLPNIAIPQIEKQINKTLGQKIEIKNIAISPQGIITIKKSLLYQPQSSKAFITADLLTLIPDYKKIFASWNKDKNKFDLALSLKISKAQINQAPVLIDFNAQARILINLDLKHPENLNYSAELKLNPMNINQVPIFGQIKDINGTINIYKDRIYSSDLQGSINEALAKLDFLVEDYANPRIELNCELNPLIFKLKCALNQDTLVISQMTADYNQISLNVNGQIESVKENPLAKINSRISLQLEDLARLPLEIKPVLNTLKPSGLLTANLQVNGLLKNIPKLSGSISLLSDKLSLLDYTINDLKIQADIENGQINLADFTLKLLDTTINTNGSVNLLSKNLDYNLRINIADLELKNLKEILAKQAKFNDYLSGMINANIALKGRALDLNLITLETNLIAKNLVYQQIILPELLEFDADLSLKNLNSIVLRKAMLNDLITQLSVNGNISNILLDPLAEITGQLNTDFEQLNTYSLLKLPAGFKLSGKPILDFKTKGLFKKPLTMETSFSINSAEIKYNQFGLERLKAKGSFKNQQLDLASLLIELYSGQLNATAHADLTNIQNPKFKLNAQLAQLDMQAFALKTKLIQTDFQGLLNSQINLTGSGAKPENLVINSNLNLDLSNVLVNNIAIEKANAQINADYQNNSLLLKDSSLQYKDIQAQAKGRISSLSNNPRINLDINSQLAVADLNKLPIPQDIKKQLDSLELIGNVLAKVNINTPLSDLTAMNLTADLSSEQLEIKKIKLNEIKLKANMANKILTAAARLKAYQGTADLKLNADFTQPEFAYNTQANITQLDFGQLIKESKIIPQQHKGIISLTADLAGKGPALKTIVGKANIKLNDALIVAMPLLKSIAAIFSADFLVNFEITEGNSDIIFDQAKATLQNTSFNGPEAKILARGAILLDTLGFENFWTTLQLTDSGAKKINQNLLSVFDFNGTIYQKEIEVKGTLSAPIIDQKKILFGLGANAILNNILKNKSPDEPQQQNSPKDMKIELLKGLLNSVLK
ncbi:MAG: hypothetical protein KKD05_10655 [Candidatus Omnitrophica bacterium]|nr:hypothetical protein [Candidatus Omnitrophota bacterium]